ncbi:MAG: BamA/TamA family outer membrane protein [Alloprevotella sp.]|nr:BamA/TamA family outer membrane protein [Alloprevotella sp.]
MLSSVKMNSTDKQVRTSDYRTYVRQEPNAKWFNLLKVPLGIYSLSPADTTRRKGRFFRRLGEAPVVYDANLTEYSRLNIENALKLNGYLHANVRVDTVSHKKRVTARYTLSPGARYYISSASSHFENDDIEQIYRETARQTLIKIGLPLNVSLLEEERKRIVNLLQDRGYFFINKDYVSFQIDTVRNERGATVTTVVARPTSDIDPSVYRPYRLRNVTLYENVQAQLSDTADMEKGRGVLALTSGHNTSSTHPATMGSTHTRKRIYLNRISLRPDSLFSEKAVRNTYSRLNALPTINSTTIRFNKVEDTDSAQLDATISLNQQKSQSVGIELEGTNTNGDLGAALVLSYTNRNLFRGQEQFSLKLRGAYEAIKGLEGYNAENFFEYRIEAGFRFPASHPPFVFRHRFTDYASFGDLNFVYDSEDRPEFHRRVLTANLAYRWTQNQHPEWQHRFDFLSLNYVFMPWISETFRTTYLDNNTSRNAILRASYENLLIMRWAYTFMMGSNKKETVASLLVPNLGQRKEWLFRISAESAGNLLQGFSKITKAHKDESGHYKIFNVPYSEYVKFDFDYAFSYFINEHNSIASHVAFGLAIPYGNSSVIPYEKRYFSGGANSVRGWSVRELGPGSYKGTDGQVDFINQTGNLKLDLSVEWRTHLFWKFDGAIFADAGNIWNTRKYEGMEEGQFKLNRFYKQIAVGYGAGVRFNVNYFVLRFDLGMKAINPAYTTRREHYPIIHPKLSRDMTFHFAVGLPF